MTLNEELFTYILDFYPDWGNSPERFLEFIRVTVELSRLDAAGKDTLLGEYAITEQELADIFINVFNVDLKPYDSFAELCQLVNIDINIVEVLEKMRSQSKDEDSVYDLVDEGGLELSKETMMTDLYNESLIWSTIKRLRPHIQFVHSDR